MPKLLGEMLENDSVFREFFARNRIEQSEVKSIPFDEDYATMGDKFLEFYEKNVQPVLKDGELAFDKDSIGCIPHAYMEAVLNAIEHGSKHGSGKNIKPPSSESDKIQIEFNICRYYCAVRITQPGEGFNLEKELDKIKELDRTNPLRERKRGLLMITGLMEHITYGKTNSRFHVTMLRYNRNPDIVKYVPESWKKDPETSQT